MKFVWSEQARSSLANIYEYVYQDSPEAAERLVAKQYQVLDGARTDGFFLFVTSSGDEKSN